MAVHYGRFELPQAIRVEKGDNHSARFIAEPFERGFGHTLGNVLRRVMLTALEAPAIVSVKLEGVLHEYMALPGIIEDVTHIILNLKRARLRDAALTAQSSDLQQVSTVLEVTPQQIEAGGGKHVVTLQQILAESCFQPLQAAHPVLTATQPFVKKIELKIGRGRGYVAAEAHRIEEPEVGEIVVDSIFSPVTLVNYFVEDTRVERETDFDRLILDVTTDGRVTPEEAVAFSIQILAKHLAVFNKLEEEDLVFTEAKKEVNVSRDALLAKLSLPVSEIELSVRSANCLAGAEVETIGELVLMPESEMLQFRNFGRKSLREIRNRLDEIDLQLGMDLDKFGINRENVRSVISSYRAEKEEKNG